MNIDVKFLNKTLNIEESNLSKPNIFKGTNPRSAWLEEGLIVKGVDPEITELYRVIKGTYIDKLS